MTPHSSPSRAACAASSRTDSREATSTAAVLTAVGVLWAAGLTAAIRSVREEKRINALAGEDDGEPERVASS